MWIETSTGRLVNTDAVTSIGITPESDRETAWTDEGLTEVMNRQDGYQLCSFRDGMRTVLLEGHREFCEVGLKVIFSELGNGCSTGTLNLVSAVKQYCRNTSAA